MTRRMLIDASHPEETRVVVMSDKHLEEFDYETSTKQQLKGNIYLAKVTRVEPSLQAAFVEYGGNRHGFLAFSEIHPDYYRIPVGDREEIVEQAGEDEPSEENGESVEDLGGDEAVDEAARRRPKLARQYKIQEVIKRRQILLVQVVKEERGNKGAALTTYLSLAGRYCVLMPNTARGGGISRKITNAQDRKRLKSLLSDLQVAEGMGVILRTAGQERSKAEIKRDYDYILRLWEEIRTKTLESSAPSLIHEEGNLIKRSLRDLYDKDIEDVLVAGEEGYKTAKGFMRSLIPSHAKRVQPYKADDGVPMFHQYKVESQIARIHDPVVHLRSGGSIVMHQTEALVAIDVNSGRATRERNIEETALKTNMEAAEEIARQLRLRDLAGLIVIDFIDMEENRHNNQVEKRLKEALRRDRARIQVGRISPFGLLEMSRQRLRPSLQEAMTQPCPSCNGTGYVASTELAALTVLRAVEDEALRQRGGELHIEVPTEVAVYLLNHKRALLADVEARYDCKIVIGADADLVSGSFTLFRVGENGQREEVSPFQTPVEEDGGRAKRKRRGRGGRGRDRAEEARERSDAAEEAEETSDEAEDVGPEREEREERDDGEDGRSARRRRGRRGGRRRRRRPNEEGETPAAESAGDGDETRDTADETAPAEPRSDDEAPAEVGTEGETAGEAEETPKPSRRRRGGRRRKAEGDPAAAEPGETAAEPLAEAAAEDAPKPRRTRRVRRPRRAAEDIAGESTAGESTAEAGDTAPPEPPAEPAAPETGASVPPSPANDPEPDTETGVEDQARDEPEAEAKPKRTGWWSFRR